MGALTYVRGGEDVFDGLGNLGANAITLDQADEVVALWMIVSMHWCCVGESWRIECRE